MAKFPPLPEYLFLCHIEKLRARDLEIWRMAMEAAASVCTQSDEDGEGPDCWDWHAKDYAAAIRALPEPSHQ